MATRPTFMLHLISHKEGVYVPRPEGMSDELWKDLSSCLMDRFGATLEQFHKDVHKGFQGFPFQVLEEKEPNHDPPAA